MNNDQFKRVTKEFVMQLFLANGIVLSNVIELQKEKDKTLTLHTMYQPGQLLRFLGFKKVKETTHTEDLAFFKAKIELAGGKQVAFTIPEEKFVRVVRQHKNYFLFRVTKETALRPKGFAGIREIWEGILEEFKRIQPYI